MSNEPANLIVVASTAHTMAADTPPASAFAIRDGKIAATAAPDGLRDLLATWRGPGTVMIDEPGLTVLPAFVDTHNHLILAGQNILGVPVSQARDLPGIVRLIAERAARTPPGQWIRTAADWHELRLAERRLPTAAELDQATTDHPVLLQRGGHNGVLNTAGLRLAGITRDTPELPGGFIDRNPDGHPRGWVQDAALERAQRAVPPLPEPDLTDGLGRASASYAAHGIGTVRDAAVTPAQWHAYRRAQADGQLHVRSHPMIITTPAAIDAAGSVAAYLDSLEEQGIKPGTGDDPLRIWGLKFVLDGGVEAAAMTSPYADRPDYLGDLMWDKDSLAAALAACALRGWPVGTHAMGDHAVATLLDAIADARTQVPDAPARMFTVEHGGLIARHIARAATLGVHVTVQQALLDGLAPAFLAAWGQERTAALFPWRGLIDAGAWISAGTDHPIGPLSPLRAVHGMTTRATPAGILGPQHAINREEALRLYTVAGAQFLNGDHAGTLAPGAPADLTAYRADPFTCPDDELPRLSPAATIVAGRITHHS